MPQRCCTCGGREGGWSPGVITYCCCPQYVLAGESQYVNNLFLSIWKFIVCEKYLRPAITGCKLGTVEDMLIAVSTEQHFLIIDVLYVIEKPEEELYIYRYKCG